MNTEHPTPGAPEEVVERIDRLAAAANAAPKDTDAMLALWREVFSLQQWLCVARGDAESPRPLMVAASQGPMLLIFTTPERARVGGLAAGVPSDELGRLLAVPMPGAASWAASLHEHGVHAVVIDYGTSGSFTPLQNLPRMLQHFAAAAAD